MDTKLSRTNKTQYKAKFITEYSLSYNKLHIMVEKWACPQWIYIPRLMQHFNFMCIIYTHNCNLGRRDPFKPIKDITLRILLIFILCVCECSDKYKGIMTHAMMPFLVCKVYLWTLTNLQRCKLTSIIKICWRKINE